MHWRRAVRFKAFYMGVNFGHRIAPRVQYVISSDRGQQEFTIVSGLVLRSDYLGFWFFLEWDRWKTVQP